MKFPSTLKLAILPGANVIEVEYRNTSEGRTMVITGGIESELVKMLSAALKFEYELVVPDDMEWGRKLESGKWSGMVGMVHRNEADIAISDIGVIEQRLEAVDYSFPYNFERVTFATKSAELMSVETSLLDPFTNEIWIAVVLSLLSVCVIARYVVVIDHSFQQILLKMAGYLMNAGSNYVCKRPSKRVLLLTWVLGALFLSSCYTSLLLSFLSFPLKQNNIDTKEQLVKALQNKGFKCVTPESSSVYVTISESNDESVQYIANLITQNQWFIPFTNEDMERAIAEGYVALIGISSTIERLNQEGIHISRDSFALDLCAVAINKGFCCKDDLDRIIHRITAAGLFERAYSILEFWSQLKSHIKRVDTEVPSSSRDLGLHNLQGAFFVLLAGWFISTIILGIEVLINKSKRTLMFIKRHESQFC